jgi:ribosomal-protein-alanine N-acetyltransferase
MPPRWPVWRRTDPDQLDHSILGYGGLWMMVDEGHVCTLGVRAEWRGRGLGELLLLSLIEAAYQQGADLVTLEVRESNLVAQNLYRKYGLQVTGRRRGYYTDNREDALIMSVFDVAKAPYQDELDLKRQALRQYLHAFAGHPPEDDAF